MSGTQSSGRRPAFRGGGRNSNRNGSSGRSSSQGGGVNAQRRGGGDQPRQLSNARQTRSRQNLDDRPPGLKDEDILIAFMPYLKGNHTEALRIHEEYQMGNDQNAFLSAARDFLTSEASAAREGSGSSNAAPTTSSVQISPAPSGQHLLAPTSQPSGLSLQLQQLPRQPQQQTLATQQTSPIPPSSAHHVPPPTSYQLPPSALFENSAPVPASIFSQAPSAQNVQNSTATAPPGQAPQQQQQQQQPPHAFASSSVLSSSARQPHREPSMDSLRMNSIERGLDALMDDGPQPFQQATLSAAYSNPSAASTAPFQQQQQQHQQQQGAPPPSFAASSSLATTPPKPLMSPALEAPRPAENAASALGTSTATKPLPITPPRNDANWDSNPNDSKKTPDQTASGTMSPWSYGTPVEAPTMLSTSPKPPPSTSISGGTENEPSSSSHVVSSVAGGDSANKAATAVTAKKESPPPKRLWTHPEEQPGKVLVKGHSGDDPSFVLHLAPREELTAQWGISLAYLRKYTAGKYGPKASLETVLSKMTLGLFRRGCTENGMQASIVSKSVLGGFWKDPSSETVRGKVPFYSPRTPGFVVFRLFWEDDPLYTLATGPTILVRVTEMDFESSVRFILSNFKGKKSNPTSLSSLHSLAAILETHVTRPNESAGRAAWGCIQEARKVMEACAQEHEKTTSKLSALEETVEDLRRQVDAESHDGIEENAAVSTGDERSGDGHLSEAASEASLALKEKLRTLMSGRASCERKWRDSQLAFASILRAVVKNQSMPILIRRDLIARMRIEYELWCPLSEEFAIPDDLSRIWFEPLRDLPQNLTTDNFQQYSQARVNMQLRTLGFDPNTLLLEDILFPLNPNAPTQRAMDAGAVNVFNGMSSAMGQLFQELFRDEDVVVRRREMIRKRIEDCVQQSGIFPTGTRVAIFGSSANGFGSPNSDLDMCLQMPDIQRLGEEASHDAMSNLADYLEASGGMADVDPARLSARIPIIKFKCPNPLPPPTTEGERKTNENGKEEDVSIEDFIECDLSVHNPLAVLNTSLLRTYAEITPIARVLSMIIKRWAKARDINNPARHTLSSYGYIIMLLHFLTFHKRTGNGLVSSVSPPEGNPSHRHHATQRPNPLLPNLQWMDPSWPGLPRGTPYRDLIALPQQIVPHPMEENKLVNRHFYKPGNPSEVALLQMHFQGHDLSLAILLASFFRYYAYEFDYKRYVVSLHSTSSRGLVEREVKSELDGWRNYSAALTIEDPFETFYDVAHVLRGGYYHRIRREFAVAYSKIADAAAGRKGAWNKGDPKSMSGAELIDWICEPVDKEKEEGGGL